MDEMQLLRELGDTTPLASAADLAPARARLTAATRPHPRRRRLAVYGAAVVGLAAAVFGVFALVSTGSGVASASADQILDRAAAAALDAPFVTPRPDQFVYLKTKGTDGSIREDWFSVDGTHDSILFNNIPNPGCRNGKRQVVRVDKPIPGVTEPCEPNPAYRPDLPTDASGLTVDPNAEDAAGRPGIKIP